MESKKVVLVTGASSGIGKATAELLAAKGFKVYGTSRRPQGDGAGFSMLAMDVLTEDSIRKAVDKILKAEGRIDVLVNNAGNFQGGALEETSIPEAQAQFDTNVFGVLRVTQAVLPAMRAQRSGHILTTGSALGHVSPPYSGLYAMTKFAVEGFSEALRAELAPFSIKVSVIEPGFVKTHLGVTTPAHPLPEYQAANARAEQAMTKGIAAGLPPEKVAQVFLKAITASRPRLRYPAGAPAKALITMKRLLPEGVFVGVRKMIFSE
ncbi:MAG TPA: SDR family NAD(P)-dependent oxidoreductase [bacterium]|nr:SDR family NAD(P)-dependent oxidoreductase [bacterium]